MTVEPQTHIHPPYGRIFLALFAFTMLEIFTANLPIVRLAIILLLIALAIIKAAMVAMFYMHLRFEKILLAFILVAPLIFSAILVLTVGSDIGHVRP